MYFNYFANVPPIILVFRIYPPCCIISRLYAFPHPDTHAYIHTRCAMYKNNDKREKTMYKNKEMKELIKIRRRRN